MGYQSETAVLVTAKLHGKTSKRDVEHAGLVLGELPLVKTP